MFKLDPELHEAMVELASLCIEINQRVSDNIFYCYSGKSKHLDVDTTPPNKVSPRRQILDVFIDHNPKKSLVEIRSAIAKLNQLYPEVPARRVFPLKLKKRKHVLVIHPRRIGRTAALAKLAEVQNG
ncbi:hypothetical protein [Maridesulfovibrio sp.]|uniref:hypothetical protein n=1 Tax=Maridesulfovibrio sp. TaxID=2795000 RepID=UPI0029CA29C7|nr:hypothetical protein [Maridesulfovibrio sp.]